MHQALDKISYIVGNKHILEQMENVSVLPLFSNKVIDFFDCLSKKLMHSEDAKKYPDVIAYAFWIRRAYLEKIKQKYMSDKQKLGRGVAFQITPSNIPVQFAVSMTYALTAGNASVIRVSNKEFEQVNVICNAMSSVIKDECPEIEQYICIIRYAHNEEITQALTDMCDVRMIWGGDNTIAAIRKASIGARCIDLGFADRYSIAVIDSEDYLSSDTEVLANDFYNDTYFSDQNACSSPRLIVWTGSKITEAKSIFWNALENVVKKKYQMDPICSSEKLLKTAICAARYPRIEEKKNDNFLVRIELPLLYKDIMDYKGNCGYFFEYSARELEEIVPILKKECQTITYIGKLENQLRKLVNDNGVRGVDRIVHVGHGADIAHVWDGLDLPNILSRQVGNE